MQFQVPQFIEVEDKIFGPLTFKQFLYFLGGAGLSFMLWRFLPLYLSLPLIGGAMGISTALAMGQWNGRPFITGLEFGFYYLLSTKLYLWSHERKMKKKKTEVEKQLTHPEVYVPKLSESRLHQLSWSLDIQEKIDQSMRDLPDTARAKIVSPQESAVSALKTARDALVR
ncbi:MAG: PrgI family protein [Candidatus Pacebacteria bacterium]|nr:PrgI family protein [Candidatus Paceibacterota bacterium]